MLFARPLADLIAEFERLPGVGPKLAQRIGYHLLRVGKEEADRLVQAIVAAKERLRLCEVCQNVSEAERCAICTDARRDPSLICVVSDPRDVVAMERLHEFKGHYHVLHGQLSPANNVHAEDLRIKELLHRLMGDVVQEVVLATNPTIEGDATALYLAKLLKPSGIRVTKLAHGMPIGSEIDYADTATLLSAFEYRREL